MNSIPPILYGEGPGVWSRIEKALGLGGPVELVIPMGGSYDALRIGDQVLILPRMVDIEEGSSLIIKLGEQGKLELVKIIPPGLPSESGTKTPLIGLDQIEPRLMARLFDVLFEEIAADFDESKLPPPSQPSTQVQSYSQTDTPIQTSAESHFFSDLPELQLSDLRNPKPIEKALELFLNGPEALSKLITTVRNQFFSLGDDEFMARLLGNRVSEKLSLSESAINLQKLLRMSVELIDKPEREVGKLPEGGDSLLEGAKFDSVLMRTLIKDMAAEIKDVAFKVEEKSFPVSSTGSSVLDILKAVVVWLKNQSPLTVDSSGTHFTSKLDSLIEQQFNAESIDLEVVRPLVREIRLLAGQLLEDALPLGKDASSFHPKVRVLDLIERFFSRLNEAIESSQYSNLKKKTKIIHYAGEFGDLSVFEIRNQLLEQCRLLERLNSSLFLDGRVLFCFPFLVGGRPEPIFGELSKNENQQEEGTGSDVRKVKPDIRFEVDFRKLGNVLGLIFMSRKRIVIFFDKEEGLNLCSSSFGLLCDELGKGWKIEFDLKPRHLNKNITA